ncbi:MAG: efflux RND transporter periplasmic adaptor subunit [Ignavibacteriae bacterium]|nr:MAG: efflux RND transporter periplasmic adaptor subunit [Ignavibacteriota bacterium]
MAENKPIKKKKKSKKKLILFSVLGAVILLIVVAAVISSNKEKLVTIQTEKTGKRDITQIVSGTGVIQPDTKVDISAEVSGEIVSLPVKEGQEVKKGELLVKINAEIYSQRIQQQRAGVNFSESQVEVAENNVRKTELEYQRIQQLFNSGLVSQSELDNARIAFETAQSQLKSSRANVNQNVAILRQSAQDLSKATIRAPMNGVVTQLNSELGERVVGTMTMAGTTIMTISDLSIMDAEIEVSETDITFVKIGDTAKVQVDAFPDKEITGVVYEISNTAKSKGIGTQEQIINFIVKIRVVDTDVLLKPGMSCNADIKVNSKSDVIAVPIQSITARKDMNMMEGNQPEGDDNGPKRVGEDENKKKEKPKEIVFVVENGNPSKVKIVTVKTGISDDRYIEITEGLQPDMEVVKGPYKAISKELEENTKVKVDNEIKKIKKEEE